MPETKLKCPSCNVVLKIPDTIAPGKSIKCPKCAETIRIPGAPAPRPKQRVPVEDDEETEQTADEENEEAEDEADTQPAKKAARREAETDDEPVKKKKKKKRKQESGSNKKLLWFGVGGGTAVLGVVLILVLTLGGKGEKRGDSGKEGKDPPKIPPTDQVVDKDQGKAKADRIVEEEKSIRSGTATRVTVAELMKAYKEDPAKADSKYKDKVLQVEGVIYSIGNAGNRDDMCIGFDLEDENEFQGPACKFGRHWENELAQLNKGQKIVVRGKGDGTYLYVGNKLPQLRSCIIVR